MCNSEPLDAAHLEEAPQNNDVDLLKQRQFIERLQRFSSLKRKSDEFLQKNYYAPDIFNFEKKSKKDKQHNKPNNTNTQASNKYDQFRQIFDENPVEPLNYNANKSDTPNKTHKEDTDKCKLDQTSPNSLNTELKTECEDSDIIITDPAVCETPKSFESLREIQKDGIEFQSPQDSEYICFSLHLVLDCLIEQKCVIYTFSRPLHFNAY